MSSESTSPVIAISDAGDHVGESVRLRGWLYNLRKSRQNRVSPSFATAAALCSASLSKALCLNRFSNRSKA